MTVFNQSEHSISLNIFHRIPASKPVNYPVDILLFNDRVNQTNLILREKPDTNHHSKTRFWYYTSKRLLRGRGSSVYNRTEEILFNNQGGHS
ncbi:hypothetical protein DPMN_054096, partial [Dreissena polymorpha]